MQPQQQPPEDSAAAAAAAAALAEPVTPQRTPRSPRLLLTWRRRKVHFPEHSPAPSDPDDPYDPLKVSAVVFGYPILTEREVGSCSARPPLATHLLAANDCRPTTCCPKTWSPGKSSCSC
jgi:hypothetical protein